MPLVKHVVPADYYEHKDDGTSPHGAKMLITVGACVMFET